MAIDKELLDQLLPKYEKAGRPAGRKRTAAATDQSVHGTGAGSGDGHAPGL